MVFKLLFCKLNFKLDHKPVFAVLVFNKLVKQLDKLEISLSLPDLICFYFVFALVF